jgi:hypothetical protein
MVGITLCERWKREREENNNKTKVLKAVTGNMFKHIISQRRQLEIVNEFSGVLLV